MKVFIKLKKLKSLVTGGAGFIGSHLVDELIRMKHKVVVIDNEYSNNHEQFYWNKNSENYNYDIRDYGKTRNLYNNVDYVFHLAAQSRIQPSILNPPETISINSFGTATVLECAKEAKVKRLVYSSSSSAYGNNPYPNVETQKNDCLNPYALSKVNGENLCKIYTNLFGLQTIILRYFNVYGERQPSKGPYAPVIGKFLRQYLESKPLTIVGSGEQRRDFTYVKDIVNANVMAAIYSRNKKNFGEVYNVGSGINFSINEVAKMISNNVVNVSTREGESNITLADTKNIAFLFMETEIPSKRMA